MQKRLLCLSKLALLILKLKWATRQKCFSIGSLPVMNISFDYYDLPDRYCKLFTISALFDRGLKQQVQYWYISLVVRCLNRVVGRAAVTISNTWKQEGRDTVVCFGLVCQQQLARIAKEQLSVHYGEWVDSMQVHVLSMWYITTYS